MADYAFLPKLNHCPICDSSQLASNLVLRYWQENPLDFSECADCGLCFANPMPGEKLLTDGNGALVRYYHRGRSTDQEFREARQAYLRGKLFAQRLRRWKKQGRFLEIGCYQGFFALGVKDHCEWEVETLEIAPALVSFVRNTLGITCHEGTLENNDFHQNGFDFIVCHDLIEHINRPKDFLASLHGALRPGGKVEIITPNTTQDFAFNRRAYARGQTPTILLNHIMNFSPTALRLALESSGFTLQKFYCYGVKHALKDFGCFGLGQPGLLPAGPSLQETLRLPQEDLLSFWSQEQLQALRTHPKVSFWYGLWREILPRLARLRMPAGWGIGHEIYALVVKR